uniref:FecR family protein n=1 Tax=Pedobacter schmidteae TaxID=2201271 RepID=UPI000EAC40D8|nr:FecR family protein [Pedobacter schmidteae]
MKQDYDKIITLIGNYNSGEIDAAGRKELEDWIALDHNNQLVFDRLTSDDQLRTELKIMHGFNAEDSFSEFERTHMFPAKRLWLKIAVAASILIACFIGGNYYFFSEKKNSEAGYAVANDILPGKNAATLTLANGKKIALADAHNGELAKEAGVVITKTSDGRIIYEIMDQGSKPGAQSNTLSTARGETYQVRLPDGTMVWINAATSLTYPASFAALKSRTVELNGEAYFEVSKDKSRPFIVKTAKQELVVLGTHFNINSYTDEGQTLTTLLEGSVKINEQTVLKPGEQAQLSDQGNMKVTTANMEEALGWKNGFFLFDKDDLPTVMRQISRWYSINVRYEGEIPKASFDGKVYRNLNLSKVLEVLKYANVKFRLEGKTIVILP